MVSTSSSPRPLSASSLMLIRAGGCGLASQTRISTRVLSVSSHSRTGVICSIARDACIALVTSSETRSSVLSLKRVSPHSQTNCRACSRAQGTAPGSAPSSMKSCSGHSLSMPIPWYWGGRTGTGAPLLLGPCTDNALPCTVPVPPPAEQATPAATRGVYALVLPFIGNLPASPGWGGRASGLRGERLVCECDGEYRSLVRRAGQHLPDHRRK